MFDEGPHPTTEKETKPGGGLLVSAGPFVAVDLSHIVDGTSDTHTHTDTQPAA